eukprot:13852468-Alexandrium_andersonii.AAC.1
MGLGVLRGPPTTLGVVASGCCLSSRSRPRTRRGEAGRAGPPLWMPPPPPGGAPWPCDACRPTGSA